MRIGLRTKDPGELEYGIIYGSIALIALVVVRVLPVMGLLPGCLFHRLTAYPCPTCGATRAVLELSQGHALRAFSMNPLVTVVFIAALAGLIVNPLLTVLSLPRPAVSLSPREGTVVRLVAAATVLANWTYLIMYR